jgi:hypothetical protein
MAAPQAALEKTAPKPFNIHDGVGEHDGPSNMDKVLRHAR